MHWRLFFSALGIVFLSEMGDTTQITTMLLAGTKPLYVFYVALGSAMALITASFIEVMIGAHFLAKHIKPVTIKIISGAAFTLMGLLLITGVIGNDF